MRPPDGYLVQQEAEIMKKQMNIPAEKIQAKVEDLLRNQDKEVIVNNSYCLQQNSDSGTLLPAKS